MIVTQCAMPVPHTPPLTSEWVHFQDCEFYSMFLRSEMSHEYDAVVSILVRFELLVTFSNVILISMATSSFALQSYAPGLCSPEPL